MTETEGSGKGEVVRRKETTLGRFCVVPYRWFLLRDKPDYHVASYLEEHFRGCRLNCVDTVGDGNNAKTIRIDENIDKSLRKEAESFIIAAARALKQGMQELAREGLGVNIGFMFKQQPAFEAGIAALQAADPLLAEYLRHARAWSEPLMESRNAIEHSGWTLPRVNYSQNGTNVGAAEPEISGRPFTAFIDLTLDRLCCFVEEFTAHCMQKRMVQEITITELPLANRSEELPLRFRLTLGAGGLPRWGIFYHISRFENT